MGLDDIMTRVMKIWATVLICAVILAVAGGNWEPFLMEIIIIVAWLFIVACAVLMDDYCK